MYKLALYIVRDTQAHSHLWDRSRSPIMLSIDLVWKLELNILSLCLVWCLGCFFFPVYTFLASVLCTCISMYVLQLLPKEDLYAPPLNIRVMDKRSFGRCPLVGTHVVKSLKPFLVEPKPSETHKLALAVAHKVATPTPSIYEGDVTVVVEDVKEALDVRSSSNHLPVYLLSPHP